MTLPPLKTLLSKAQKRSTASNLPAKFVIDWIEIEVMDKGHQPYEFLGYLKIRALVDPLHLFAVHRRPQNLDEELVGTGEVSEYIDITYIPEGRRMSSIAPFECWTSYPKMLAWAKRLSQEIQASPRLQILLALPQRRFKRLAISIASARIWAKKRTEFEEWMSQPLSEAEREILDAELDRLYPPRT